MKSNNILSFILFADDTKVYVQNDSFDIAIEIHNTELAKLFNVNKTQMIMLSRKKILTPQNEVILRNYVVQRVNKDKFIGVKLINTLIGKTTFQLYIKKVPNHVTYFEFVLLYISNLKD